MSKMSAAFQRPYARKLARRMREPRRFIQVVAGARQVGKTTLVQQVAEASRLPVVFASADEPTLRGPEWIAQQWEAARLRLGRGSAILVIDEVQKAAGWAESVKGAGTFFGGDVEHRRHEFTPKNEPDPVL